MRKWAWVLVLVAGGALIAWAAIHFEDKGAAFAVGLGVVFAWIAYGTTTGHYLGLRRKILRHLRTDARRTAVVTQAVPARDRVNVQVVFDRLREASPDSATYGCPAHRTLKALLSSGSAEPEPMQWEALPTSLTETHACATNGLYLLRHRAEPFCATLRATPGKGDAQRVELEVMARTATAAQAAADYVMKLARERSVYRGKVVSLERLADRTERFAVKFHDMPPVSREAIVLPAEVLEVVERNVLGLLRHGDVLRAAGRATRHGVLFHGPPGTGKTLVTRYLANACADYSVILLTGRQLSLIRESCQLAKLLAPSMVVLEDVDLVAAERGRNRHNRVLHELLDEMDGLGAKSDCIFLLTTNRPDVLEPALAARPGRVDQAIYFPLPDAECRRRLFGRFAAGLDVSTVDVASLVGRTEGASPAFIQELFRKAALMAAERGERGAPLKVTTGDFDRALRELLEFGGDLTRNLLGFNGPAAPSRTRRA